MTVFDTEFLADAWPALAIEFGETVTYTPAGGIPVDVTAIVDEREEVTAFDPDATIRERRAEVLLSADAITSEPNNRDSFTIDGETWAVVSVQERRPIVRFVCEMRRARRVGDIDLHR